jgi:hypothetical protein
MHLKGREKKLSPEQWVKGLLSIHPEYAGIKVAVETGTFRGDGPKWFAKYFREFHTVEINEGFYKLAQERCRGCEAFDRIHFYLGDSAEVLPKLVGQFKEPVLWMLDAHYCEWSKAVEWNEPHPEKGKFPLWDELHAIAVRPYADIVLIDDSPLFGADRSKDRAEGDTGPQWESINDINVIKALGGRVIDAKEWQKSRGYWRRAK